MSARAAIDYELSRVIAEFSCTCGAGGWIQHEKLLHGVKCPTCGAQYMLDNLLAVKRSSLPGLEYLEPTQIPDPALVPTLSLGGVDPEPEPETVEAAPIEPQPPLYALDVEDQGHPGDLLESVMEEYKLDAGELAKAVHSTKAFVDRLLDGDGSVSVDFACRMERFSGGKYPAAQWMALQVAYDLAYERTDPKMAEIQPFGTEPPAEKAEEAPAETQSESSGV